MRRVNKNNKYNYNYRDKKDTRVSPQIEKELAYIMLKKIHVYYILLSSLLLLLLLLNVLLKSVASLSIIPTN
jgi:hypothetical protein